MKRILALLLMSLGLAGVGVALGMICRRAPRSTAGLLFLMSGFLVLLGGVAAGREKARRQGELAERRRRDLRRRRRLARRAAAGVLIAGAAFAAYVLLS